MNRQRSERLCPDPLQCIAGGRCQQFDGCPNDSEPRECGEPLDDGSGRVCRRMIAPGRDYHGGGHWYANADLDGGYVREATATWIVTGRTPEKSA